MLVAALALLPLACGGSGGGGGVVTLPATCVQFVDGQAPTSGQVTSRQGGGSTCEKAAVELVITDVNDVFGVGFTVHYDPTLFAFTGVKTNGSLLASGGADVLVLDSGPPGQVLVGASRVSPSGVDAIGTQLLLTLSFKRLAESGSGQLTFTDTKVLEPGNPPPPTEIPNISWSGGKLRIK